MAPNNHTTLFLYYLFSVFGVRRGAMTTLVTEQPRRHKTAAGVLRPHAAAVEPVARHGAAPTTTLSTQDRAVAGDRARAHAAWAWGGTHRRDFGNELSAGIH